MRQNAGSSRAAFAIPRSNVSTKSWRASGSSSRSRPNGVAIDQRTPVHAGTEAGDRGL